MVPVVLFVGLGRDSIHLKTSKEIRSLCTQILLRVDFFMFSGVLNCAPCLPGRHLAMTYWRIPSPDIGGSALSLERPDTEDRVRHITGNLFDLHCQNSYTVPVLSGREGEMNSISSVAVM